MIFSRLSNHFFFFEGCVGTPLPGVEVRIAKFIPGKEEYEVLCAGNNQGTKVFTDGEVR